MTIEDFQRKFVKTFEKLHIEIVGSRVNMSDEDITSGEELNIGVSFFFSKTKTKIDKDAKVVEMAFITPLFLVFLMLFCYCIVHSK